MSNDNAWIRIAFPAGGLSAHDAVQQAVATLDYAPAFQFGHPASFALANKIKDLTPAGLALAMVVFQAVWDTMLS